MNNKGEWYDTDTGVTTPPPGQPIFHAGFKFNSHTIVESITEISNYNVEQDQSETTQIINVDLNGEKYIIVITKESKNDALRNTTTKIVIFDESGSPVSVSTEKTNVIMGVFQDIWSTIQLAHGPDSDIPQYDQDRVGITRAVEFFGTEAAGRAIGGLISAWRLNRAAKLVSREALNQTVTLLRVNSKAEALKSIENLPPNIQKSVKDFFKGGSNAYIEFSVEKTANGNYLVKMTKPGNVPGSRATYYKEIFPDGTSKVYKDTFDPSGNLVHRKDK